MLDLMRRKAGSWFIKGLLVFIALTFVWWGVGAFTERDASTVATVGGRRITTLDLDQAATSLEKSYRDVYGSAFTSEMAKALDLRKEALKTLVQREILLAEAGRMGLSASDAEVQREISTNPAFQGNGTFSEERYRSILEYNRMSPSEYENTKRIELTLRKVEGVIAGAARVTDAEAREIFDLSRRRVRLVVAAFDPARARGTAEPTDAEISSRYAESKEKFRIPSRVKLTVAKFTPEAFGAAGPAPSDQELRAFHEGNLERFRSQEEREVTRAFFPAAGGKDAAREKASDLSTRVTGGKDEFVKEARKAGAAVSGATLLRKGTDNEIDKAVFSAGAGGVVGPLAVEGGFSLYRIDRIRFPETIPFEQVRGKVEQAVRQERGRDQAVIEAYKAREGAEKAGSLKGTVPAAASLSETGWLGDAGGEGLPPAVLQEALVLPAGAVGPVKSIGEVHYLFRVAAKEDSRIPPLPEVKERIASALRAEKSRDAARAQAAKAIASSKSAAELEAAARSAGAGVVTTAPFAAASGKFPPPLEGAASVSDDISRLTTRSPVLSRPAESAGLFLAVALVSEEIPSNEEWTAERDSFLKKAQERKKEELLSSFVAERLKAAKVVVNEDAIK